MSLIKLINFAVRGDDRGSLIALEKFSNVPFAVKRVYYIFDTARGVSRGFHAHKKLKQLAITVKGSCRFVLDNGSKREEVILSSPSQGLLIEGVVWREMHDFSEDCVLLVLASELYDENDYIRNHDEFLAFVDF